METYTNYCTYAINCVLMQYVKHKHICGIIMTFILDFVLVHGFEIFNHNYN